MAKHSKYFPVFVFDETNREEFDNEVEALRELIDSRDDLASDDYSGRNALNIRIKARGGRLMRMPMSRYKYTHNHGVYGEHIGCRIPKSAAFVKLMEEACIDYDDFIDQYLEGNK